MRTGTALRRLLSSSGILLYELRLFSERSEKVLFLGERAIRDEHSTNLNSHKMLFVPYENNCCNPCCFMI